MHALFSCVCQFLGPLSAHAWKVVDVEELVKSRLQAALVLGPFHKDKIGLLNHAKGWSWYTCTKVENLSMERKVEL
jgi:hypothetical protein